MKVGHASYGCYGAFVDFLVVGKNIFVTDEEIGYIGYATSPEEAYNLLCTIGDYDKKDVFEVINFALQNMKDEKPYEKALDKA